MKERKVIIIDLMPLVFRAYFATLGKNISTAEGIPTGGILGFYNYIFQLIFEHEPDLVIATQDSAPEERTAIDPRYKANREESPEELEFAVEYAYRLLYALNIPVYTVKGQEADDVIGSLSQRINPSDKVFIVSPDKDLAQLVNGNVILMRPAYKGNEFNLLDREGVREKFGVYPERIPDLLALMGDTVDNIKGVPGIGEKTAAKLLSEHGSIEELYESGLNKLKEGKIKDNLTSLREDVFRSKKLATVKCDLDVKFPERPFSKEFVHHAELASLLEELEFRQLAGRLQSKGFLTPPAIINLETVIHVESWDELERDIVAVYPFVKEKRILCVAGKNALYVQPQDFESKMESFSFVVTNDLKSLHKLVPLKFVQIKKYFDITVAEYLINPDKTIDTDHLARKYKIPYPLEDRNVQAEQETVKMKEIYEQQIPLIEEMGLHDMLYNIELPLSLVLAEIEETGVYMDSSILADAAESVKEEISEIEQKIYSIAGREFNINSTVQIGELLEALLGKGLKKTVTGKISSSEKILEDLRNKHVVIDMLLRYRKLNKLYGTYLAALPKYISKATGRIHATFSQVTAGTGRLSCHSPNLQNLPVRHEEGRSIRKAVKAQNEDYEIIAADYSQVELRLLAALSGDENMIRSFAEDQDIHSITAARILKMPPEAVTEKERNIAKGVNFGVVYGITPFGLSDRLKISQQEAREFISNYFLAFPQVKEFQEKTLQFARENGYTQTLTGRIRYIEGINSRNGTTRKNAERVALNAPIQGLAADLIKIAMIRCEKYIRENNLQSRMILQIHDELLFEAHKDEFPEFMMSVKAIMEGALSLQVPLKVEIGHGEDWMDLQYL